MAEHVQITVLSTSRIGGQGPDVTLVDSGAEAARSLKRQLTERELLADEKELAEHNMLVDLGRNDLGRISTYGSVEE